MAEPLPLVAYETLEDQLEALYRDGYAYLPNVLNTEAVAELREQMDIVEPRSESFDKNMQPEEHGYLNKHVNNTFNRHPLFLKFLDYPGVIEIAEGIHGDDCHSIGMTAWMTGPGRPDQKLHTDWLPISLPADVLADPRVRVPIFITTAHFYLDDLTEELGPTNFIPGSHLSGCSPNGATEWQGQTEKSIMCKAGDVVIFRSEVWHRGTANTSDKTRYLLQVHYAKRMVTQKFPPYLNRFQFDPEILKQANPRQLRLMGDHKKSSYD
ncbi:MAG: dioxygenase [Candidatus Latescibacteria bacterium]|jgi:ectoine hydroxylase-related dioxygenase (phytanoyl-CoA dioxygenase family)|nr:dioxygenase [Candidatus Latescibacterota bacterium]MBT4139858.1 dioxygenase [Candidatus Latescibacterota bacterium]